MPSTTETEIQAVSSAPIPNPRNNVTMFKIFQNVQYNVVQHKKYVKEMKKLHEKLDDDIFRESFKNALMYLFTFGDMSANVDRVVQFVASFCTALDDEDEFLQFVFEIIFDCQCVSGQSVRYRASQLLAAVLSALGEDAALDDDLCDKLLDSQLKRLQDTRGAVRCRAALALQRLQNPPDDAVTRAYRFHMSCDPSSSVRRAVLMTIAKTKNNVPFVLERLCDVDEAVRRAAFLYMAAMSVLQLKVTQRIHILKVGLTERSQRVRRVVEEILVPGWLSTFRGNIVDLLKAIRLDDANNAKDSQYVAGKLLESLFKRLQMSELLEWLPTDRSLRLIPAEKLNKETAWYWRHLAEHLQQSDDEETLETVLPDLVVLIGYIKAIVESPCPDQTEDPVGFSTRQYVLHELGCMLRVYDTTDPAGRIALQALITDTLTGDNGPLDSDVIRAFVHALELVVPEVNQRMEVICGVVGALRDPPEPEIIVPPPPPPVDDASVKLERARLRVALNVAMEAQDEAAREQNYALAAECKTQVDDIHRKLDELVSKKAPTPEPQVVTIKEKRCDSATLNKCLTILNCAMDTPQLTCVTPMLKMMFTELEVEIFKNPDVLDNALETIAIYGMLDKEMAKENKPFFFANTTKYFVPVTLSPSKGDERFSRLSNEDKKRFMLGLLVVPPETFLAVIEYVGCTEFSESAMSLTPTNHSTVIELLLQLMDSTCAAYRLIIVEGLCRLLHLGHLESPAILSRLLLLWFNPATVDEDMLRQTIGVFFQTFPMRVDGAQEQIQKCTMPTLRTLANAPSSSPLSEIDQEAVVRFIVSLTRVNHELIDSQGAMAMVVTQALARDPACSETGLACRLLALLSPPRDALLVSQLAVSLRNVAQNLPDKQSARNLTRYLSALQASDQRANKMSNIGETEGTLQQEDTMTVTGRNTTSLPQPIARSTHVVINDTVLEELEIDETSPSDAHTMDLSSVAPPMSTPIASRERERRDSNSSAPDAADFRSDSSSGVSPVKKVRVTKEKRNKLPVTKRNSDPEKQTTRKDYEDGEFNEKGGVKRSRSQRSVVDVDRAKEAKAQASRGKKKQTSPEVQLPPNLDVSNVTVRKSVRGSAPAPAENTATKGPPKKGGKKAAGKAKDTGTKKAAKKRVSNESLKSRNSKDSRCSPFEDSADETELHTIVYDAEFEQSLLNDSCESSGSRRISKGNVTIPETPDASDESESEEDTAPAKSKGKKN